MRYNIIADNWVVACKWVDGVCEFWDQVQVHESGFGNMFTKSKEMVKDQVQLI